MKKLPAPERSGYELELNLFFVWIVLGIEKNLQMEIWSIKYFPNLPEVSLKPEEFDLVSELSRILSVDTVSYTHLTLPTIYSV